MGNGVVSGRLSSRDMTYEVVVFENFSQKCVHLLGFGVGVAPLLLYSTQVSTSGWRLASLSVRSVGARSSLRSGLTVSLAGGRGPAGARGLPARGRGGI